MTEAFSSERQNLLNLALMACDTFIEELPTIWPDFPDGSDVLSDGLGLQRILSTVKIARDLVANELLHVLYLRAQPQQLARSPLNDALLNALLEHLEKMRTALRDGRRLDTVYLRASAIREILRAGLDKANDAVEGNELLLTEEHTTRLLNEMYALHDRLRVLEASSEADAMLLQISIARMKAEESASKASTAAGRTGEDSISTYYQELADKEGGRADWYRRFTVTAGFVAGLSAAAFLVLPEFTGWLKIENGDYVHLVQRVIVTAAVLGVAGYFARQAHQHRSLANWAASLAVQLKTFEAYIDPIEHPDARNELRKSFAARAFGEHPSLKGETPSGVSPTALDAAIDVVSKVTSASK